MDVTAQLLLAIDKHGLKWHSKELMRGDTLYAEGTVDTNVYFIEEGALRIIHETASEVNTIRFAYKNSLFASLDSFLTDKPTAFTAEAIKKTRLRVLSRTDFMSVIHHDVNSLKLWNSILSYTIAGQLEREVDILTASPAERYNRVLKRSPQLFQEIPHHYIASYLRMAPETLSRLKKS